MSSPGLLNALERVNADLRRPFLRPYDREYLRQKRQRILSDLWETDRIERELAAQAEVYFRPTQSPPVYPTGEEDFRCSMCQRLIGHPGHCWPCAREWELL